MQWKAEPLHCGKMLLQYYSPETHAEQICDVVYGIGLSVQDFGASG